MHLSWKSHFVEGSVVSRLTRLTLQFGPSVCSGVVLSSQSLIEVISSGPSTWWGPSHAKKKNRNEPQISFWSEIFVALSTSFLNLRLWSLNVLSMLRFFFFLGKLNHGSLDYLLGEMVNSSIAWWQNMELNFEAGFRPSTRLLRECRSVPTGRLLRRSTKGSAYRPHSLKPPSGWAFRLCADMFNPNGFGSFHSCPVWLLWNP